jgi:hypothetical protein
MPGRNGRDRDAKPFADMCRTWRASNTLLIRYVAQPVVALSIKSRFLIETANERE